jgi:hypothetical protein
MSKTVAFLASLASAATLATAPAAAAPLPAPLALSAPIDDVAVVQPVACARYGWRGWGVYPGCYPRPHYAVGPYYAPVYVAARPYYYRPPLRRCWIAGAWRRC